MALDFPNSPTLGQVFTSGTKKWTWDGSFWNASNVTPTTIISDTPPTGVSDGQLWFDSSSGVTNVRYDNTWIDVGGGDSGTSAGSVNGIVKSDGSGNFSAAVAGTDYLTSTSLSASRMVAKAWVNFNGTTSPGTIRSSYNVSSVTKNGTGDYTVNFTTPMADANYSISGSVVAGATDIAWTGFNASDNDTARSISNFRANIWYGSQASNRTLGDSGVINLQVFGN